MEMLDCSMYILKIVLDATTIDESTLTVGHKGVKVRCQPVCQDLPHNFCYVVHQADGSVFTNCGCIILFRDECDVGGVEEVPTS